MADFRTVLAKAQLDAARDSAKQLTDALREATEAAAALNKRGPMTPQQAAVAEVKRLTAEAKQAEAAYKSLTSAQAKAMAGNGFAGKKPSGKQPISPWDVAGKRKESADAAAAYAAKSSAAKGAADGDGGGMSIGGGAEKGVKYLARQLGIGRAAMAAFAVAGVLELSKLAMGWRGMAMLSALSARASLQLRSLFKGVDPSPVTRAFDRFLQLVNPATASGKALSVLFTNIFGGFFGAVEKAEPIVSAFAKLAVLGALKIEIAWLRLRIAALPLTEGIEDAIGSVDGLSIAVTALSLPFKVVSAYAETMASALTTAWGVAEKLNKAMGGLPGKVIRAAPSAYKAIYGTAADVANPTVDTEGLADRAAARFAKVGEAFSGGEATGKSYADGLAKGAASGAPKVDAAGQALATALDAGTRKKGEIHSPSQLAARTGAQFPAGTVVGSDSGLPDVRAAGERVAMAAVASPASASSSPLAAGSSEVLMLLREIAANTRPRGGASGGGGFDMRAIAMGLGIDVAAR